MARCPEMDGRNSPMSNLLTEEMHHVQWSALVDDAHIASQPNIEHKSTHEACLPHTSLENPPGLERMHSKSSQYAEEWQEGKYEAKFLMGGKTQDENCLENDLKEETHSRAPLLRRPGVLTRSLRVSLKKHAQREQNEWKLQCYDSGDTL